MKSPSGSSSQIKDGIVYIFPFKSRPCLITSLYLRTNSTSSPVGDISHTIRIVTLSSLASLQTETLPVIWKERTMVINDKRRELLKEKTVTEGRQAIVATLFRRI